MDLGQECSWFLEDRDPWTPDIHPEPRSWPRPLNQESPSLSPSNPPPGECWYPREMSELRLPSKISSSIFIHLSTPDQWYRSFLQTKPLWRTRGRTAATLLSSPAFTHHQLSLRTPSQWPGDYLKSPVVHLALKMAQSSQQSKPNAISWLCQELASVSWPALDEFLMWTHWGGGHLGWCFGNSGNLVCDAECLTDFRSRYMFEQPGPRPVWEWAGAQVFLHQNPVSINSSSFYRPCSNRNRVPYSLWASPPYPQPEHLIPELWVLQTDTPSLNQLPNVHSLMQWHCPFLPHSQVTPKQPVILSLSTHGNPAWKVQLLSFLHFSC